MRFQSQSKMLHVAQVQFVQVDLTVVGQFRLNIPIRGVKEELYTRVLQILLVDTGCDKVFVEDRVAIAAYCIAALFLCALGGKIGFLHYSNYDKIYWGKQKLIFVLKDDFLSVSHNWASF